MTRLPNTRALLLALVAMALPGATAAAQDVDAPAPPAHITYVDGRVVIEHEDGPEEADASMPVVEGDRVRTEEGRAEIEFGAGSLVQLDAGSTLDVLSDTRLRLLEGRMALLASRGQQAQWQVDTPEATVAVNAPGEYRLRLFEADGRPTLELSVVRGEADLASDRDRVLVGAGERSWARRGEAPAYPVPFNAASLDGFDRWALDRAMDRRGGTTSAQYVPPTLRSYAGVLDTYGSWDYEPSYGYVWYPRVEMGWRPYYAGRWRHYGRFGWTWVGGGAWGWPTHHYGRWGLSAGGAWFWIPGAQWGPAWVSWAYASDYVSWCPIGVDGRPVVGWGSTHHGRPDRDRDAWHAWTVVPRQQFGGSRVVSGVAVDRARFDGTRGQAPSFVVSPRPPAAPRAGAPGARRAGGLGVAVPRSNASADPQVLAPSPDQPRPPRRFSTGSLADAAPDTRRAGARRLEPQSGSPTDGNRRAADDPRRDPRVEQTPEELSGRRVAVPRSSRPAVRLPGDIGGRPAVPPGAGSASGDVPIERPQPNGGWRADQVPVYRGGRVDPSPDAPRTAPASPAPAPNGVPWDRAQPRARGGAIAEPAPPSGAGDREYRVVPPRGDAAPLPRAERDAPAAPRRGSGVPDSRQAPPPRMGPSTPPPPPPQTPPSAAPRQAPSGDRGGRAVPRSGPPPSRSR